jgi:ribA/ribD-fused uncharacterized protein
MGGPGLIDGKVHEECDNFSLNFFFVDDVAYPTAEHYFQCQKTFIQEERDQILSKNCALNAWAVGNKVKLRPDWESIKVRVMYEGNKARFEQNSDITKSLCSTTGRISMNGSTPFWNKWNGLIMERIRAELRNNQNDKLVAEKIKLIMDKYESDN